MLMVYKAHADAICNRMWHGVGHESRGVLDVLTRQATATGQRNNTLHADSDVRAVTDN